MTLYSSDRCAQCGHMLGDSYRPLTRRQREIMVFLEDTIHANGYAPSFDEIAARFGYHSLATVHEHLTNLERKGWIRRRYNETRSIEITETAP